MLEQDALGRITGEDRRSCDTEERYLEGRLRLHEPDDSSQMTKRSFVRLAPEAIENSRKRVQSKLVRP
jgi:hypothetical protein